jgi:hypothetical protein
MLTTEIQETEMKQQKSTSIAVDPAIWREVKKTAVDLDISATKFLEQALTEKLSRVKRKG